MKNIRKKTISYLLIFFITISSLGLSTNIANATVKFGSPIRTGFVWGDDYEINVLNVNGNHAYCLEPNKMITDVDSYTEREPNFSKDKWNTLVKLAHLGYNNKKSTHEDYAATQVAIWRKIMKWENKKSPSLKNSNIKGLEKKVKTLEAELEEFNKMLAIKPSFDGNKNIKINSGTVGIIKDANKVLGKYPYKVISKPEGAKVSIDKKNNSLKVDLSSSKAKDGTITLAIPQANKIKKNRFYYSSKSQHVANIGYVADVKARITFEIVDVGSLKLTKTSESGKTIEGVSFKFKNNATGKEYKGTTDKNGSIKITLPVGKYKVSETSVPKPYILDKTVKEIVVEKNKVANVSFKNNMAKGKILLNKVDGLGKVLKNAEYRFWSTSKDGEGSDIAYDKTFKTDEKGQIKIENLPLGTYNYQEIKAPLGYIRDTNIYSFEITYKDQFTPIISIVKKQVNSKVLGKFELTKYSKGSMEKLAGAKYRIWSKENNTHKEGEIFDKTFTTDKNGKIVVNSMELGEYYCQEIKAPYGYILDDKTYEFSLRYKDDKTHIIVVSKGFENEKAVGRFELTKTNENGISLKDAQYRVWSTENSSFDKTFKTDINGKITIDNLALGKYYYQEIAAPVGYVRDENVYTFELKYKDDKTAVVKVQKEATNSKAKGRFELVKFNEDKSKKLKGAMYRIWSQADGINKEGDIYDKTVTTDEKGKIVIDNLELGKYYYQEIKAPFGYICDENKYEFHLEYENDLTPVVEVSKAATNSLVKGTFQLTKLNDDGVMPLKDAEYRIWSADDKSFDKKFTTDEKGKITVENLSLGKYYYQETKAPLGYVRDKKIYEFELKYKDDKTAVVKVQKEATNSKAKGRFELVKFNEDKSKKLKGAMYRIWSQADGINKEGDLYDKTVTTDEKGKIVIDNLELGKYYYQEIKAPFGYICDENKYEFQLEYENDLTPIVEVSKAATNNLAKGSFELTKLEDYGIIPLEGAEYRIWSADDKSFDKKFTTDEKGKITVENLSLGKYYYQEVKAPFGYIRDDLVYEFELKYKDDKTAVVKEYAKKINEEALGRFELIKYDKDTKHTLQGAKYHIWSAPDDFFEEGVLLDEVVETDEDGVIWIEDLYFGKYYYQEIKAPYGYVKDDKIYEFEVNYIDDETPIIEVDAEAFNQKAKGQLKLVKYNHDKSQKLERAEYRIWSKGDENHKEGELLDKKLATDENGEIKVDELQFGTYYYQEVNAPEGYLLDDTVGEVEIKYENDETPVVEVLRDVVDKEPVGEIGLIKTFAKQKNITTEDIKKATLKNAVYELYAKENITNKAGTITYYEKGEKVGSFKTDEKGITNRVENLPLGIYSIRETKAPEGCKIDTTVYDVELKYKDQHTANISKTLDVEDEIISTPLTKTSDDTPIGAIVLLMIGALSGSLILGIKRKN